MRTKLHDAIAFIILMPLLLVLLIINLTIWLFSYLKKSAHTYLA